MKINIEIKQIDNGFILHLFDEDGLASHDQDLFFEDFNDVLKKIEEWEKEAREET